MRFEPWSPYERILRSERFSTELTGPAFHLFISNEIYFIIFLSRRFFDFFVFVWQHILLSCSAYFYTFFNFSPVGFSISYSILTECNYYCSHSVNCFSFDNLQFLEPFSIPSYWYYICLFGPMISYWTQSPTKENRKCRVPISAFSFYSK